MNPMDQDGEQIDGMGESQQQQHAVQFTDEEIQNLKEIFDLFDKE